MHKKRIDGLTRGRLQAVARSRMGASFRSVRTSELVQAISARYPETRALSKYEAMAWVIRHVGKTDSAACPRRVPWSSADDRAFLRGFEWRRLRLVVRKQQGRRCVCCGASPDDGVTVLHVDHIKPRKRFPELALEITNLQVLCESCNHGKGNWDETDWRSEPARTSLEQEQPLAVEREDLACAKALEERPSPWAPRLVKKAPRVLP
jgi:hypothetical protein